MTGKEILSADLLDILFDNRNKQYGAYTLRRYYENRMSVALFSTLLLAGIVIFFVQRGGLAEAVAFNRGNEVIVREYVLPQKPVVPEAPKPQPAPAPAQPKIATAKLNTRIEIVRTTAQVFTDVTQVRDQAIGAANIVGRQPIGVQLPQLPQSKTGGNGGPLDSGAAERPFIPQSSDPEFPGGMKAWIRFLQGNLRTPDGLQAGDKVTVMMRFLVASDGKVTGIAVVQSGGSEYDSEVMRALKKMPQWKPAMQNGYAVARQFTQPVTFVGLE